MSVFYAQSDLKKNEQLILLNVQINTQEHKTRRQKPTAFLDAENELLKKTLIKFIIVLKIIRLGKEFDQGDKCSVY